MKHNPAFTLLLTFLLLLVSSAPVAAQDTGDAYAQLSGAAQAIADGVNVQRANAGLPPLLVHPLLNQAAQAHVDDMIANGFYGHMGSDGSYAGQRVQRTGYTGGWASENWVATHTPEQAINWWMNDWIHRENILNSRWQEIGIGVTDDSAGSMIFVTVFTGGGDGEVGTYIPPVAAPEVISIPTEGIDYTIQPGDTLLAIAYRYGLDWTVIARANDLGEESLLQIEQVIRLPGVEDVGGPVASEAETNDEVTVESAFAADSEESNSALSDTASVNQAAIHFVRQYTVQPGNTLADIAELYEISWQELAAANNLDGDSFLRIGQQLEIPGAVQAPVTTQESAQQESVTPPQYHTVIEGDTMISIALQYDLDWEDLLDLNNMDEDSLLTLDQEIQLTSDQ